MMPRTDLADETARNALRAHLVTGAIDGMHRADELLDNFRAEVLRQGADKFDRIGHGAAAWILRDDARQAGKDTATGESTQPEPLTVHWDRTVIDPDGPDDDETIVCCLTDDGKPVALILDDELREALGLTLVGPDGERDGRPGEDGPTGQALQLTWTDKVVTDNATGAATVSCITPDGSPAELQLDEEHREALGGMLLDEPEPGDYEDGDDGFTADELHEMDQADEAQLDAIDEALEAERGETG